MDEAFAQLVANLPSAAAVIFTVYIMAFFEEKRDKRRDENAKLKSTESREHQLEVSRMYSDSINLIMQRYSDMFVKIGKELEEHEDASKERYEKMQITNDLIKLARENAEKSRK